MTRHQEEHQGPLLGSQGKENCVAAHIVFALVEILNAIKNQLPIGTIKAQANDPNARVGCLCLFILNSALTMVSQILTLKLLYSNNVALQLDKQN
ncbi:hypothetical protein [Desulfotruncus arcticus]|uniref:hypothetical protein n=1 Tax=Desulfotruncus arcticus TaxID=341036 RepID=UPI000B82A8D2|nr:hypothetical protein [Desulfotruncus arcticus]